MKVLPLVLREGLRSELGQIFDHTVKTFRSDMEDLPASLHELFTLTRAQCGLKDTMTQFTLRGAKHSRNEGSITEPAPLGIIARVI